MGEKRLISHAEELQRMYADPLPSRRVIVTPHSTGVSFFQSVQPGREGVEGGFTVAMADRYSLSRVTKASIKSPTSCGWYESVM